MKFKKMLSMIVVAGMMLTRCQSSPNEMEQSQDSVADVISTVTNTNEGGEQAEEDVTEEVKVVAAATVLATKVLADLNAEILGLPVTSQTLPEQSI